jgi:hypothetical protein
VTLGPDDGTTVEIASGVGADDPVVLDPRGLPDAATPVAVNIVEPGR